MRRAQGKQRLLKALAMQRENRMRFRSLVADLGAILQVCVACSALAFGVLVLSTRCR